MSWKRTRRLLEGCAPAGAVCILILATSLAVAGCAGELPVPGATSSTSAGETTATTEGRAEQLGKEVGATWSEAIQKLVPLLEGTPPVASLQASAAQLKEEYVQKIVALGREIEALDPSERQAASEVATHALDGAADTEWFRSYVRLYDQYAAGTDQAAQDFAVLLSTFNTLTQYAFFDLLREESPDEAQRLGIE